MKPLFAANITNKGRLIRAIFALLLFIGSAFGFFLSVWLGAVLAAIGSFTLFEAWRGWCGLRACGIKTKF